MAAEPAPLPEQLARRPDFVSDLALVDAALMARKVGIPTNRSSLANQAADRLASSIMQTLVAATAPLAAVPAPLLPAATAVLRFWLPHIRGVTPAVRLCPEVQAVLRPATRASVAACLAVLAARGEAQAGGRRPRQSATSQTMLLTLPLALLAPGSQPPFGRPCRVVAQKRMLLMSGPPPREEVSGVSGVDGAPRLLDLQTLAFALARIEETLPHSSVPPLALLLLGEGGFECAAACGLPCLEPAHIVMRPAGAGAAHHPSGP